MAEADDLLQLPITHTIAGRQVKFHRFTMRDLVTWCAEEKAARKREVIQRHALNPRLDPAIKNDELKKADAQRISFGHLMALVDEPDGVEKVLRRSLALSQEAKTDADADVILAKMHWSDQMALAIAAMSPPAAPAEPKAAPDPTDGAADASGSADSGQTSS